MMGKRRFTVRIVFSLILLVIAGVFTQAQEPRTLTEYFSYYDINATGCGAGTFSLKYTSLRSAAHRVGTLVRAGGKTYMDENASLSTIGVVNSTWTLFSSNNRDNQTSTFPLPLNTPFAVESTLYSTSYEPLWRTVVKISQCNGGTLTETLHYKATELLNNNSFEVVGVPNDPLDWVANAYAAASVNGVECTAAFQGTCSLFIGPVNGTKTKYSQVWTGSSGVAGDTIELSFLQRLSAFNYSGGGKVVATLTFANGTSQQLQINPTGAINAANWHLSAAKLTLPAPLIKAKVVIIQKNGVGTEWRLDDLSLAIFHPRGAPPLPLPPAMSADGLTFRGYDAVIPVLPSPNSLGNGD